MWQVSMDDPQSRTVMCPFDLLGKRSVRGAIAIFLVTLQPDCQQSRETEMCFLPCTLPSPEGLASGLHTAK